MKSKFIFSLIVGSALLAPASMAMAQSSHHVAPLMNQKEGLSTAGMGCYVDTPRFDHLHQGLCFAFLNKPTATAVFGILGIDWSNPVNQSRYTVTYDDCDQQLFTTEQGPICEKTIHVNQSFTEHATVTDTSTGQSIQTQATAHYEYLQ
ncbi:MAG: hypothetical protein ACRDHZ_22600 [Ktedonobacteraceae bacterium]